VGLQPVGGWSVGGEHQAWFADFGVQASVLPALTMMQGCLWAVLRAAAVSEGGGPVSGLSAVTCIRLWLQATGFVTPVDFGLWCLGRIELRGCLRLVCRFLLCLQL
jgi:hypothetical protein